MNALEADASAVEVMPLAGKRSIRQLDLIVKITERCNIACSYCYYFEDENRSPHSYPSRMSLDVWGDLLNFVRRGALEKEVDSVSIIFHGGEPLLMQKKQFDQMCDRALKSLGEHVNLKFALQTNAVLVSPSWIQLFKKYKVDIGVSIDGPAQYNDVARIDHKGNGTYASTAQGVKLLMAAAERGDISRPGALVVINPDFDPKVIFDHLINDLGFTAFDTLLPHFGHGADKKNVDRFGQFLCGLFDAWVGNSDDKVYIRVFRTLLDRFAGRGSYMYPMDPSQDDFLAIVVKSNGSLRADDAIEDNRWVDASVRNTTLESFMNHPLYLEWLDGGSKIPVECVSCCWANICRGGHPYHRYEHDGAGYNRKSRYCEALMEMYSHVTAFMLRCGYPLDILVAQLGLQGETMEMGEEENAES